MYLSNKEVEDAIKLGQYTNDQLCALKKSREQNMNLVMSTNNTLTESNRVLTISKDALFNIATKIKQKKKVSTNMVSQDKNSTTNCNITSDIYENNLRKKADIFIKTFNFSWDK